MGNGLDTYFDLARVSILPPQDMYHPVLLYRCQNKLTFPLCAAYEEALADAPLMQKFEQVCDHASADRALTATWCTLELEMALRKGYKLIFIHQMYHCVIYSRTMWARG